jgi:osmotically-inducible protein OsmY
MRVLLLVGAAAFVLYRLRGKSASKAVPDDVLITKVRKALDKAVEHSGSIDIQVRHGEIVLSGPIGEGELKRCVLAVRRIPGVHTITNRLRPHAMEHAA